MLLGAWIATPSRYDPYIRRRTSVIHDALGYLPFLNGRFPLPKRLSTTGHTVGGRRRCLVDGILPDIQPPPESLLFVPAVPDVQRRRLLQTSKSFEILGFENANATRSLYTPPQARVDSKQGATDES
jgi:hypothetical protein